LLKLTQIFFNLNPFLLIVLQYFPNLKRFVLDPRSDRNNDFWITLLGKTLYVEVDFAFLSVVHFGVLLIMNLFWERWHPLFASTFTLSILTIFFQGLDLTRFQDSAHDIFIGATTIAGIVIGFLSASQAVLLSLDGKKIILRLKESNVYRKLLSYLMDAIHWAFILAILSSIGLLLNFQNPQAWYVFLLIFWLYSLLVMTFSCYRTLRVFNKILRSLD